MMDWPANSPDLNLIKTLWAILKDRLNKHHLELFDMGSGQDALDAFAQAITDEWWAIPQETIDSLIKGMDNRVNEVLHAKGWYTRR